LLLPDCKKNLKAKGKKMLRTNEYRELVNLLKSGQTESYRTHELKCCATDDQLISSHKDAGVDQELNQHDLRLQDQTDGAIQYMLKALLGHQYDKEWDISLIGDIRDAVVERLARETGRTEYSFHPYMIYEGKQL